MKIISKSNLTLLEFKSTIDKTRNHKCAFFDRDGVLIKDTEYINEIKDDANMYNLIEWDSLSHIKIVLEIEERLQRELNTEEIIEISDLESINKLFT